MKRKSLLFLLLFALLAPWAANAQTLTVHDGTTTNNYVPIYGYYADAYLKCQMVYPAEELSDMAGQAITEIKYYTSQSSVSLSGTFQVWIKEIDATTLSEFVSTDDAILVYEGTVGVSDGVMDIVLEEPYTYRNSNLLVGVYQTATSNSYPTTSFYGETVEGASVQGYSYSGLSSISPTQRDFLPKTTFSYATPASCAKPTNLAVSNITDTEATLGWTSDANSWQICVNGDEANPIDVTTNPYTLQGLTAGTVYTVKVRANCGGDLSEWSNPVSFNTALCAAADQCLISYQLSDSYGDGWNGNYINVVDVASNIVLATWTMNSGSSASGTLAVCDRREIQFQYVYPGGYTYPDENSWVITDVNGEVIWEYSAPSASISQDYTVNCAVVTCRKPTDLVVSDITARSASLSWTENGEAEAWEVEVVGSFTTTWNATENPYTIVGLEPETHYTVRVRAICGEDDYSDWSTAISFTTGPLCIAPTNMTISDITAYSANIGWTSDNTNFEVRYCEDTRPIYGFDDSSFSDWTTIDADADGYDWVLGSECGGIYLVEGASLAGSGHNSSEDFVTSGSYSNVTGALTPDNYLVSPQVTLGGSISFWACAQDAGYSSEHFGVFVSTTDNTDPDAFTMVQEWTFGVRSLGATVNPGTTRSGNRAQSAWVQYTVDLSAYSGQGYVAIRHFNCTDMFMLNIDDIFIDQPGYELQWVNVENPTNPQALTDLDPETTYLVQVRAICDEGPSAWLEGTFTTLPACMVPTNLVVSNIDKRAADLAWTANGLETAWQICVNGDEENLIDVTETTYSFTELTPETEYTVKVRANCGDDLVSDWSTAVTFTTLVACPAPTELEISDITLTSAVASWTYEGEGDIELQYAEEVWMHYDNGTYGTSIGMGTEGARIYWGSMFPASMLTGDDLTHVALYENDRNVNDITVYIYQGGDTAPGTLLSSEVFTPVGGNDFHEVRLTPVTINPSQNLWVVFSADDAYPAQACPDAAGEPNNRWVSFDNEEWMDVASAGVPGYGWMIRAAFGTTEMNWITVENPATPQALTDLTDGTNYVVRVRAICGGIDGESEWVMANFTTISECLAPWDLTSTDITANSASLSWEGYKDLYKVRYRKAATIGESLFSEGFEDETTFANWTFTSMNATNAIGGSGTNPAGLYSQAAHTGDYGFRFSSFSSCSSETGATYDQYLVSPELDVTGVLSFYFKKYNSSTEHLYVGYSTTTDDLDAFSWSADLAPTQDWQAALVELPTDVKYIAFHYYGSYTYYVYLDDIDISALNPAGEWVEIDEETSPLTINGLDLETDYEWQVKGSVCDDTQWSASAYFTTLGNPIQTIELTEGWNWISTYIAADDPMATLQMLETALGENATQIKSADSYTDYYEGYGWYGPLDDIGMSNQQMYMVMATNDCQVNLQGPAVDPATVVITIYPGWNWIGFPFDHDMTPDEAFANFTPTDLDVIKGGEDFWTYYEGFGWYSETAEYMVPGQGYMYNSFSDSSQTLVFPSGAKALRAIPVKVTPKSNSFELRTIDND